MPRKTQSLHDLDKDTLGMIDGSNARTGTAIG